MTACFCNHQGFGLIKNAIVGKNKLYKVVDYDKKVYHVPICKKYIETQESAILYETLCTKGIIIINTIIRLIIVEIMTKVGYKTESA